MPDPAKGMLRGHIFVQIRCSTQRFHTARS